MVVDYNNSNGTLTGLFVFILTLIGCVLKFEASFCAWNVQKETANKIEVEIFKLIGQKQKSKEILQSIIFSFIDLFSLFISKNGASFSMLRAQKRETEIQAQ